VLVSQLAWTVAAMVLIPAGLGVWIDRQLGTTPWAVLVGALIGTVFATIGVTRLILRRYEALAPSAPPDAGRGEDQTLEEDEDA